MQLLLSLWREACRHIELNAGIGRLADLVSIRIPLDLIIVRRLNLSGGCLETVAVGSPSAWVIEEKARTPLEPREMEDLLLWCRRGQVMRAPEIPPSGLLTRVVPSGLQGSALVGPLAGEDGPTGTLIMLSRTPNLFKDDDAQVMQLLLEPFAVALENDRQFHEMARLRETAEAENRSLRKRLQPQDITETIIGAENGLKDVMQRIEQVAPTSAPVLLFGETGSGKEVVARAIHQRSARPDGPLVRVNCGAIPTELVDSELFGHERGSFTGAVGTRRGWFERADGGTLFLDEIGELPLAAQVRLLRILQDGTFERVGGQQPLSVDVRILAATHRDVQSLVRQGAFREDLWYRISVFPIHLPPLRKRKEDIPALAAHFARGAGLRLGASALAPTPADISLLMGYDWPGNVRELAAVIERAVILGEGKRLELQAALGIARSEEPSDDEPPGETTPGAPGKPIATLDEAMAAHIAHALHHTHGRIEGRFGAAGLLGINPHTLRARMRKLGVDWSRYRDA